MSSATLPISPKTVSLSKAVLWGGLVAGVLDAADGVVAFGLKGLNPIQVLQYIASGLLGPSSFNGGLVTAALGTVLHFVIAFGAASVYVFASRRLTVLKTKPVLFGLLFGLAVYLFMSYLVLPLSAVAHSPFSLALFLNGVIGHALFVGVPIAWYAGKSE
jgi:hypothetical protein